MAGDERTGVAIIRVTEELDAGPVALCEEDRDRPEDDYGSLSARSSRSSAASSRSGP